MEFLYLSPEFPPNYASFILQLNRYGANVWALGEADFYTFPEHLRNAILLRHNLSGLRLHFEESPTVNARNKKIRDILSSPFSVVQGGFIPVMTVCNKYPFV